MDEAYFAAAEATARLMRELLGRSLILRDAGAAAKAGEAEARRVLIKGIRGAQAAAKRKYAGSNESDLKAYYIGEEIATDRARIEEVAAAILSNPETATLAGYKNGALAALGTALQRYRDAVIRRSGVRSELDSTRAALVDTLAKVNTIRREILFTVDGLWPPGEPANVAVRREFGLPRLRALNL